MTVEAQSTRPRAAASVNLAAVVVACVATALLLPGMPRGSADRAARTAEPVRVVDAPASNKPCAEQSWPYLESHCLKRAPDAAPPPQVTTATSPAPVAPTPAASNPVASSWAVPPKPSPASPAATATLSPLTAVPVTPGVASPSEPTPSAAAPATSPSTDYARTYTAGSAVAEPADLEDSSATPPEPRPKRHRGHRGFHPFGFLGIRF